MIELSKIRIDGGTQPRAELNQDTVAEYAELYRATPSTMPPVTLFFDGANYWLADGFHRYFGAKSAGLDSIEAEIISGTLRYAILFSLSANSRHGLKRSNADKRKAVKTLLDDAEWGANNDSWIAEKAGVGRVFVVALRKESILSSDNKIEKKEVKRVVTRNGKTYEMNVASIGSTKAKQRPLTDKEERIVRQVNGSCVYLLSANDRVKVGWTRHGARSRVEDLLRSTPMATVVAVSEGGNKEELAVHKLLECERDAGEWFVCSAEDAIGAMKAVGLIPLLDPQDIQVAPAEEAPPEYTPLDQAMDTVRELQDALALANAGHLSEDDKTQAADLIARLREEVRILTLKLRAVTASRDQYQTENGELKRQITRQRREIDKLAGTKTA